jgi:hypothetical protein
MQPLDPGPPSVRCSPVRPPDRSQVLKQLLSLLAMFAGAIVVAVFVQGRPATADELDIQLSQLRSQAGDVALLAQQRAHVPSAFARAHSEQLLKKIDATRADLESLRLREPELRALRDEAVRRSRTLAATLAP